MSYLRDHIIAARAYEKAFGEEGSRMIARVSGDRGFGNELAKSMLATAAVHKRAADIMQAELDLRYKTEAQEP